MRSAGWGIIVVHAGYMPAALAAITMAATGRSAACQHVQQPVRPAAATSAQEVPPVPAVGAVFLGGTDTHTCTGAVVHSEAGDLVLTAAHCLAAEYPATFVPGFDGNARPADVWRIDTVYLDPRWVGTQDTAADYAFARVSRPAAAAIEAVAGSSLALGVAPREGTDVTITGYPLGVGGSPGRLPGGHRTAADGYPSLRCGGLVDGTSGAPWISGAIGGGRDRRPRRWRLRRQRVLFAAVRRADRGAAGARRGRRPRRRPAEHVRAISAERLCRGTG